MKVEAELVLVVEDDPGVLRLQQKHLERAGFRVVTAGTAQDALARVRKGDLDLVVLDNRLPDEQSGLELYEHIKQAGFALPAIMVTGFSDEATAIQALRHGIRDFVTKSVEYLEYLPEAVRRVLRQAQLERQLAESEALLAAVIGSARDAILTVNATRLIRLLNPAAEQLFGRRAAEVMGQPLDRFLVGLSPVPARNGSQTTTEFRGEAIRPDGVRIPVEVTLADCSLGGEAFQTIIARDISHRLAAEARLREQAELLDKTQDAILVENLDGKATYWNRGAERLYGWPAAEALHQDVRQLLHREPAVDRALALAAIRKADAWTGELTQFTRDGSAVTVASRWSVLRDETGQPRARLVINTDVTAQKQLEVQLLRAQRLECIGTLAGGIAHDLNNLLTPLAMGLELLRKPASEAQQRELIDSLLATVQSGADIVRQVLLFARGRSAERTRIDLAELLREVERLLRRTLPRSIELSFEVPENLWPVEGVATQISQLLTNLCINSRDAMPEGGRLTVAVTNAKLGPQDLGTATDVAPGRFVRISVRDTGVGIAPESLEHIFDPFFTTKEPGKGTGLGLMTVQGIARSHHGFVTVRSKVGEGTEFSVHLPADTTVSVERPNPEFRPSPAEGNRELVLVVDDEPPICMVARVMLEAFGYQAVTAGDGLEALDVYQQHREQVRVVITDTMMPRMDGLTLIRRLRELEPTLPIVAASGMTLELPYDVTNAPQAIYHLPKPYTAEQLLTAIQTVLRK